MSLCVLILVKSNWEVIKVLDFMQHQESLIWAPGRTVALCLFVCVCVCMCCYNYYYLQQKQNIVIDCFYKTIIY